MLYSPAVERLITELSKLPGIGPRTASGSRSTSSGCRPEEVLPLAAAITEVKEKIGFCRRCFNLAEGDLCTDLRRHAARPRRALRGRAAVRRRHRSSARGSSTASTTCSAGRSAPRRRRPRRPAHRRAARARADGGRGSHPRHQPDHDRRGDRLYLADLLPAACASRASPAGCRWAATSSTPTSSRWAAPSRDAARCGTERQ